MSIVYRYGRNLYINLTNRCPCSCIFCVRDSTPRLGDADSLWLKEEPSAEEVLNELAMQMDNTVQQIVFCGYGEPTERLETLVEIAPRARSRFGKRIRLDTNGLGNLINGRNIVPELAKVLDSISISLNAPDAKSYKEINRHRFGETEAYESLLQFIRDSKEQIGEVTISIVGGYQSGVAEQKCAEIAEELGVHFRVR